MSGLIGKRVKLFFNDMGKVLCKEGIIISENITFTQIKVEHGIQAIPTCNIVRMEVSNYGN